MPTPNERKALIFFSAIALTGGVVRVAGAVRDEPVAATAESRAALARQISAVDSARQRAARKGKGASGKKGGRAATVADDPVDGPVSGAASGPVADAAAPAAREAVAAPVRERVAVRYLSAGPALRADGLRRGGLASGPVMPVVPVDVDRASEAELEALPGVGPAMARRIVASRDSLGPFGNVAGLRRVRGVGPAVAARLLPYVTFSGRARPFDASAGAAEDVRSRRSRGRRSSSSGRP